MSQPVFAFLTPREGRLVLFVTAIAMLAGFAVALSPVAQGFADKTRSGTNDISLYQAEVDRIRGGEAYYEAAATELVQRGYPTRSVFNWRTPLPMWLIGVLPDPVFGKAILGALAVATLLFAFEWMGAEGGRLQTACGFILLAGGLLPCFLSNLYVMPTLWAGALIALSVCALAIGKQKIGVACGIAAVFVRDLAGPFCVVALAVAVWRRRWKEAAMWTAGLGAYGVFFLWHIAQVAAWRSPEATAHAQSWVQFGGLSFLLATAQMHGFLLVLPQWVSAVYLPLAMLGFLSWSTHGGRFAALAAAAYLMLFATIGMEINQYWGSLIAPLLCLGASRAPLAVKELWQAAELSSSAPLARPT